MSHLAYHTHMSKINYCLAPHIAAVQQCLLPFRFKAFCRLPIFVLYVGALAACGGGGSDGGLQTPAISQASTTPTTAISNAPDPVTPGTPAPIAAGPPTPTSPPASAQANTCNLPNFQAEWLQRVNALRASTTTCAGRALPAVGALQWNTALQAAASAHSQDMVTKQFFSHTGSNGQRSSQRVSAQGYNWSFVGENIAAGQTSIASAMNAWATSATGHCENMMNASAQDMAVACVLSSEPDIYRYYWTMLLAKPQ